MAAGGYTNCVASDIGKTVTDAPIGDTGTLIAYNNTTRQWVIDQTDAGDLFDDDDATVSIGTGTGAGGSIIFQVAPAGSSGTAQNALATAWQISGSGHILAGTDNTYDIGASAANRPRTIYAANAIQSAGVVITAAAGNFIFGTTRTSISSAADGLLRLTNQAGADFNRLQLGGGTNAFPALKRNGVGFDVVRADDTAGSFIRVTSVTVANLPAAATAGEGARAFVSDASVPVFGSAVVGGGAVTVPVYSTGAAWNVG
jgi:hypothetical protein